MAAVFGMLFDGVAYGMLLFLMSVGLSVTLGMMNFVNLAHCSFAMLGGYVTVTLMNALGWPFFATLPVAFIAAAAASVVLERLFFRRFYNAERLAAVPSDHRHRLRLDRGGGLYLRHRSAAGALAGLSDRVDRVRRRGIRRLPAVPHRHGVA